jgi:hypothetical protein
MSRSQYEKVFGRAFYKGKDWDTLTLYGQGAFTVANWDRLSALGVPDAVQRALKVFGGKIFDRKTAPSYNHGI